MYVLRNQPLRLTEARLILNAKGVQYKLARLVRIELLPRRCYTPTFKILFQSSNVREGKALALEAFMVGSRPSILRVTATETQVMTRHRFCYCFSCVMVNL